MKKILIALDYDPSSQKIAEAGFSIAQSMNAGITLLHVISDDLYYSSIPFSPYMGFVGYKDVEVENLSNIELTEAPTRFLEFAKKHLRDENIEILIKEGDFADSILEGALSINADMIVIGSHSRSKLSELLIGSVTEKVLRHTTIPLLIIPVKNK